MEFISVLGLIYLKNTSIKRWARRNLENLWTIPWSQKKDIQKVDPSNRCHAMIRHEMLTP
jgi:hypothetical protein